MLSDLMLTALIKNWNGNYSIKGRLRNFFSIDINAKQMSI